MNCTYEGWILTKTRKFAEDGRLQIGQILAKPFEPEQCLLPRGPPHVPDDIIRDTTEEFNVSLDTDRGLKVMFNLWAETSALPVEAKGGADIQCSSKLSWQFDSLKSTQVSLPYEYVEESLGDREVTNHLKEWHIKNWKWNRRIFIVTGVTIAKGASMDKSDSKSAAVHTTTDVNLTSTGVPASVGESTNVESRQAAQEKVGQATDFVFAYSVNEVFYREKRQKSYRTGPGEVSSIGKKHLVGDGTPDDESDIEAFILEDVAEDLYTGDDELSVD